MGATKNMIIENPLLLGECFRPELHWMEEEYFNSIKKTQNEIITEIKVYPEVVSGKETEEKVTPKVGGEGHHESEIFDY